MWGQWSIRRVAQCRNRQLQSWLRESGSLTARCEAASQQFRVRLLSYRREPALSNCHKLRTRRWVREVVLECDQQPVIFAHTELVDNCRGYLIHWLAGLGSRSLGSLLFSLPGFVRGEIEYCRLDARHLLFRRAQQAVGLSTCHELWARRSLHTFGQQSVLVTEVFLPKILLLG